MAEAPALALRPLNGPQDPCPQTQVVRTLYPLLKVQLTCLGSRQRFPKGRLCDTDRSRGSGKRTPLWTITCGQDCSPCLSPVKTHPACEQTKGSEKSLSKETCLTANKAFPKLFFFSQFHILLNTSWAAEHRQGSSRPGLQFPLPKAPRWAPATPPPSLILMSPSRCPCPSVPCKAPHPEGAAPTSSFSRCVSAPPHRAFSASGQKPSLPPGWSPSSLLCCASAGPWGQCFHAPEEVASEEPTFQRG